MTPPPAPPSSPLRLLPLADDQRPALAARLRAAGLPADDVDSPGGRFFRAVAGDGAEVGGIGWQQAGGDALLRSLLVAPDRRGEGHGRAIVAAAEAMLTAVGVDRVWLLTTTATALFDRLGYARMPRGAAPPAIQATDAFAHACPATAVCFARRLGTRP